MMQSRYVRVVSAEGSSINVRPSFIIKEQKVSQLPKGTGFWRKIFTSVLSTGALFRRALAQAGKVYCSYCCSGGKESRKSCSVTGSLDLSIIFK